MKSIIVPALISSFLMMAVFGFVGMAQNSDHGHANCIAVAVQGTPCLSMNGTLGFADFHISALKKFSTAVFAVLIISLALVSLTLFVTEIPLLAPNFYVSSLALEENGSNRPRQLIHWFSLHENSPSLI